MKTKQINALNKNKELNDYRESCFVVQKKQEIKVKKRHHKPT